MKCLLKETKFKKLEHCCDRLGLDRIPGKKILECLNEQGVNHCIHCKNYPKQKTRYKVEYFDEGYNQWIEAGLEMCHGDILCDSCKKDKSHIDNCSYIHTEVECKQIALDKQESLIKDGFKTLLKEVKPNSSHD